jgi:RNA polymerase sigma factor for flagellar operon FliA
VQGRGATVQTPGRFADFGGDERMIAHHVTRTSDAATVVKGGTMAEEHTLAHDKAALVEEHLPLVEHIVLRLSATFPRFIDRSDLVSAGTLGLVEAAHRFDPSVGVPFGRYAARRIRGAILDLLRSTDWAPRSVRALTRQVERAEQTLTVKNGRRPDDEELAAEVGISAAELAELRGRVQRGVVMAMDHTGDDERRNSPAQRLYDRCATTPDESVEFAEVRGYVRDALDKLPERHRMVAIGYYLEGRSFEELAELLSITPSRVSQLRAEAVIMMRDGIETQYQRPPATPTRPVGRVARRQARYAAAIARNSSWRERLLSVDEPMVTQLSSGLKRATGT